MGHLQDIDPRFRHIGKKVFFFILASILGTALAIYVLGREKDLFSAKTRIHLVTNTATGITRDMPVKLAGFRIGKVSRINLDDYARVIVDLDIKTKYMKWVREDSTATLLKEGYVGDSVIELSFGAIDKPVLKQGAIIKFERAPGIVEIAQDLVDELKPVAIHVKNFVEYITDPQGDVTRTLKNTAQLTADLRGSGERLQALLDESRRTVQNINVAVDDIRKGSDAIPAIVRNTDKTFESVNAAIADFNDVSKMVKTELPPILKETRDVVGDMKKISSDLSKGSPHVEPIMDNMEEISEDGRDITQSLKGNWLLRRNLPPSPPPVYLSPEPPSAAPGSAR